MRHSYLWFEIQRATQTFTRPICDLKQYETWFSELPICETYSPFVWNTEWSEAIDVEALGDLRLAKLFAAMHHYRQQLMLPQAHRSPSMILSLRLLLLCADTLNYCVHSIKKLYSVRLVGAKRLMHIQRTAAALAALWWIQLLTRVEKGGGYATKTAPMEAYLGVGPRIPQLIGTVMQGSEKVALEEIPGSCKEGHGRRPGLFTQLRLRLWIHHMASSIEASLTSETVLPSAYHTQQLVKPKRVNIPYQHCMSVTGR